MATIDKQSVREQFDKIKTDFESLAQKGKVSTEVSTLFNAMIMLFNIILTIFLEKKTKKTSKNSSIPPSQSEKDETTPENNKTNGKGQNEAVTQTANTRTVETTTVSPAMFCRSCGQDLKAVACRCIERRTRIDIIFEKTVEHVDAESNNALHVKQRLRVTFLKICQVLCNMVMVLKPMLFSYL